MGTTTLMGNDTIILDNELVGDLADNDCATLTYSGDISAMKRGKNGNTIVTFNQSGKIVDCVLRVIKGSSWDIKLQNKLTQMENLGASFVLMSGNFIKFIGDGEGNVKKETYIVSGGAFKKKVNYKDNTEGDSEQGVSVYELQFANSTRTFR